MRPRLRRSIIWQLAAMFLFSVATSAHVEHYAKIVEQKFILRSLINAATNMVTKCFGESGDPGPLLDEAEGEIFKIAETMR